MSEGSRDGIPRYVLGPNYGSEEMTTRGRLSGVNSSHEEENVAESDMPAEDAVKIRRGAHRALTLFAVEVVVIAVGVTLFAVDLERFKAVVWGLIVTGFLLLIPLFTSSRVLAIWLRDRSPREG